MTNVDIQALF